MCTADLAKIGASHLLHFDDIFVCYTCLFHMFYNIYSLEVLIDVKRDRRKSFVSVDGIL